MLTMILSSEQTLALLLYIRTQWSLKNILANLIDKEYVYCGTPLVRDYKESNKKINFLSGAGIIFNKKTIQLILKKKNQWDHNEWALRCINWKIIRRKQYSIHIW